MRRSSCSMCRCWKTTVLRAIRFARCAEFRTSRGRWEAGGRATSCSFVLQTSGAWAGSAELNTVTVRTLGVRSSRARERCAGPAHSRQTRSTWPLGSQVQRSDALTRWWRRGQSRRPCAWLLVLCRCFSWLQRAWAVSPTSAPPPAELARSSAPATVRCLVRRERLRGDASAHICARGGRASAPELAARAVASVRVGRPHSQSGRERRRAPQDVPCCETGGRWTPSLRLRDPRPASARSSTSQGDR